MNVDHNCTTTVLAQQCEEEFNSSFSQQNKSTQNVAKNDKIKWSDFATWQYIYWSFHKSTEGNGPDHTISI